MKLLWMRLHNFRQFEGTTPKLQFAQGQPKNVTIIFGGNGSGKTALLNALTWAFFGKFTDAFALPEQLVNRRAIHTMDPGRQVSAWVEVMFEHHGRKYHLKRMRTVIRGSSPSQSTNDKDEITLAMADTSGHWQPVSHNDISDRLGSILPVQLHSYFFFDGERIERLQRPDKREEITSAITIFTGEEIFRRSVDHMSQVAKRIEGELKELGDVDLSPLFQAKDELEKRQRLLQEQQAQHEANLDGFRRQKQAIEQRLRDSATVKEQQERRDFLTEEDSRLRQTVLAARAKLADLISSKGYWAFLGNAFERFSDIVDELEAQGELPTPMKAPFVRGLLERGECICGRPLSSGQAPYDKVEAWMQRSGLSSIEEVCIRMQAEVDRLKRESPRLHEAVLQEQEHRDLAQRQLSRVEEELYAIRCQLKGSQEEDVRSLQEQLDAADEAIEGIRLQQHEDRRELEKLRLRIGELDRDITKTEAKSEQQAVALRRLEVCRKSVAVLEEARRRLHVHFRKELASRISRIFSLISFKAYSAVLSADYTLSLLDSPDGSPVGMSSGESQILSLAFIGAVIENARAYVANREGLPGPDSSSFPVVMDSPFGHLDPLYRTQICGHIPELADQVVVHLNRAQWEGDVERSLGPRIAREYLLAYYSPKPDAQEDSISRFGRSYSLVKRTGDAFERTEIVEVVRDDG